MERVFYIGRLWIWPVLAVVYGIAAYFYFTIEGRELAYAIYIPLDFFLFLAMGAFWVYYYQQDKKKKRME